MENLILIQLIKENNKLKIKKTKLKVLNTTFNSMITLKEVNNSYFYSLPIIRINKIYKDKNNIITVFSTKENIYYNIESIKKIIKKNLLKNKRIGEEK